MSDETHSPAPLLRRCTAEGFGTFCLVFAGTGAIVINAASGGAITHPGIALTFGLIVMAMIQAVGDVSGAHLNPAVTLGFFTARRLPGRDVLPYIGAQFGGAIAASLMLALLFPADPLLGATLPAGSAMQSLVLEIVLTLILMVVILSVSTGSREKGLLAGITIGGVVALEAMFAGPICGASMNPARSLAPAVVSGQLQHLWLYLAGPAIGPGRGGLPLHSRPTMLRRHLRPSSGCARDRFSRVGAGACIARQSPTDQHPGHQTHDDECPAAASRLQQPDGCGYPDRQQDVRVSACGDTDDRGVAVVHADAEGVQ